MEFYITKSLLEEMINKDSLSDIIEKEKATALVPYANDFYVICGGATSGRFGYQYVQGYKAVDLRAYSGNKDPLEYFDHFEEVSKGNRERSYCGLKLKYAGNWIVLTGPQVKFYPKPDDEQLQLFK
ncbi:hypothetical protein R1T16_05640 [Flavobacterium sp. DG1-102-2]|uniref:hypothetical protein n=1 Tax=Flavobacterium sp. DG1-102-2 TaxID=3081663 RepID=UPI0029497111|nr:hypothetical protein [Flavobacterium sp. DG1-102-2]MDV6167898.1 hypothetical protein [Flavobacterium sp. DG1-102-2]